MPIKINSDLPAKKILENENIFVMDEKRAIHQDIRPLRIAILNLMPIKQDTETQLLRGLSNTPLQVDISLIYTATHLSKNTSASHLDKFYITFDEIKKTKFDGLIITGAPVETLEFTDVTYWDELKTIMDWSKSNVTSTLHICWGAQAGLYYHYGINKQSIPNKMFGIFEHNILATNKPLVMGFDDVFYAPHSRHTTVEREDILKHNDLELISESKEAGVYIVMSKDGRQVFVTGHPEYDLLTLHNEYIRDINKGMNIDVPKNYYPDDNPKNTPKLKWRSHANNLYTNWLNYYVYQVTPFEL